MIFMIFRISSRFEAPGRPLWIVSGQMESVHLKNVQKQSKHYPWCLNDIFDVEVNIKQILLCLLFIPCLGQVSLLEWLKTAHKYWECKTTKSRLLLSALPLPTVLTPWVQEMEGYISIQRVGSTVLGPRQRMTNFSGLQSTLGVMQRWPD